MDRLRVKLKKILNKDVTSLLNKYKIPLVSIAVVVVLACIGLIVTYAFYQVVDTKPIIGGSTTEISDLDVRIMAEERDVNGNGLGSYGLYPYIPKAGYKYNSTKSYCTNGSVINYDANNYDADITAYGHDVCYLYFDSTAQLDITLNVYAENVDSDGNGNGEYTKLETTALPTIGYELNTTRSSCKNGTTVSYIASENLFSVESSEKDVCDIYMDAMDVDIALKIYVQAKKNSTLYYEAKSIPTNNFYALGTKSACTGTSTMSIKNQKVVVSATGRTNCVAYLDVSSGPMIESMKVTSGTNSATITLGNSNLGTTPTTYYYSNDGGANYVTSASNTYTFTSQANPSYAYKAYSTDASGNTSRVFETSTYGYYGLVDYSNQIQTKTITEPGYYKLETWGAQGGDSYIAGDTNYRGGYGGYSTGIIKLEKATNLYVVIGGSGQRCVCNTSQTCCGENGGFNGGGKSLQYTGGSTYYGSGGGATHIATIAGLLSELENNKDSIILVSGGGGGASNWQGAATAGYNHLGGDAGGISGMKGTYSRTDRNYTCTGGTQTAAGTGDHTTGNGFGLGAYAQALYGPGSGAGYYGGGDSETSSCGGSGYIGNPLLVNKSMYCYNCTTSSEESTKTFTTTCHSANATENCAKEGNGYAIITYIGENLE